MDETKKSEAENNQPRFTCKGDGETLPFCNGVECPDWGDCHGDKLRGYSLLDYSGVFSHGGAL